MSARAVIAARSAVHDTMRDAAARQEAAMFRMLDALTVDADAAFDDACVEQLRIVEELENAAYWHYAEAIHAYAADGGAR